MRKRRIPGHLRRLGAAIRKRRITLGLSQERLAELAQCHRNYIGNVERGEQNITVNLLVRLASALTCTLSDLFKDARL